LPLINRKLVDDIAYEVECATIVVKDGVDVDIGTLLYLRCLHSYSDRFSSGANPSAEEQQEALEDGAKTVNNVVHSFRLQQTSFDKKSYLVHLKVCFFQIDERPSFTAFGRVT
jgi:hypothetical protein